MYRIGVDVGGTFTDLTLFDEETGGVSYHKVASTPSAPATAIRDGIAAMLARDGVEPAAVVYLGHGTTVATNMIVERRGSVTGLLVTKGFRDILDIGRQVRPHLYDYSVLKPVPLVPRERRLEVDERVGVDGDTVRPLDEEGLRRAIETLRDEGVKSIAVVFLHAYREPAHERRAREMIEAMLPDVYVSISSDVLPEFREYERLSTTVLNSYVGPRMKAYLASFLSGMERLGIAASPYTVHSNGGLMSAATVQDMPVRTCLSGPAAGVVGATEVGRAAGFPNIVTFDVGGTSTDVSLVHQSRPLVTSTRTVADYPLKVPMLDIHVIGAGGGSIAALDDAGALKVGPQSAGADPGPAAYGRGGEEPTLTDANIVLHRLDPGALLGGHMAVDEGRAHEVLERRVAGPLGLDVDVAAYGIIQIAVANMARAIRSVSTERGHDVKEFALFAYGGAGPLHAVEVAIECGIPTVIVPEEPGTMCARGMLLSDISLDFVRTEIVPVTVQSWGGICDIFRQMQSEADAWLDKEEVAPEKRRCLLSVDARYQGQNFEVPVDVHGLGAEALAAFERDFAVRHAREYGYDIPGRTIELVNCRLKAVGVTPKAPLQEISRGGAPADAVTGTRAAFFGAGHGRMATHVYDRARLAAGATVAGPAIIEEMSSTTVVPPGFTARIDRLGNIVITVGA